MSLTADDGVRVFVDGIDVTDRVDVSSTTGAPERFDITLPKDYTLVNGDTLSFTWTETTTGRPAEIDVHSVASLSGRWRVARDHAGISAEDYEIIDSVIIDSVARGHARRL